MNLRATMCGLAGLLVCLGAAVAAPGPVLAGREGSKEVKFDPSFEKSLWGVQGSQQWKFSQTLHVNAASKVADDKGAGSAEKPLKTVSRAVELAKPGTRVLVYPGTYHETIALQKTAARDASGTAEAPIVIEATEPGKVVVSGADVWRDWKSEGDNVYSAAWTNKWGFNSHGGWNVGKLGQRSEMVFLDDLLMRQVLERKQMAPDNYWVDETGERLYIRLKDGVKPEEHRVEVTVRELGLSVGDEWDVALYPSYVAVRGIAFNRCVRNCFLGMHVLLEDCRFEWNNEGTPIGGVDYVLRRVAAEHNGGRTFVIPPRGGVPGLPREIKNQHLNGLLEDVTASYGNWRLFGYGGMAEWATAGIKVHTLENLIIRRAIIQNNEAPGIWLDTKCNNVLLEDSLITDNKRAGIWAEINDGEIVVRNNILARNTEGFRESDSSYVTIQGNTFYGNTISQIGNWHHRGGRGGFRTAYLKIVDNRIVATNEKQLLINLPGQNQIAETGTFSNNVYYQSGKEAFSFGKKMNFEQWQAAVNEKGSIIADPMFRAPEKLDFALKPESPLRGR